MEWTLFHFFYARWLSHAGSPAAGCWNRNVEPLPASRELLDLFHSKQRVQRTLKPGYQLKSGSFGVVKAHGRSRPYGRCNPRRMVHFPNGHCAAPQIESGHRARRSFRCRAKTQWARPGHKVGTKWAQDGHKAKRRPFGAAYIQF